MDSDDSFEDIILPDVSEEFWEQVFDKARASVARTHTTGDPTASSIINKGEESGDVSFGSFSELSPDEWRELDAKVVESQDPVVSEEYIPDIEDIMLKVPQISLLSRFKRGSLSVTNFIEPLWCEVKTQYDLLGKKKKGAEKRPETFESIKKVVIEGKEVITTKTIKVDKTVAKRVEKVTKRGQEIHDILEKELTPVKIQVPTSTREETFGLKIINMITALHSLRAEGIIREVPVFGSYQGIAINGVIDELNLKLPPINTPYDSESFFIHSRKALYLSDTKTRVTSTAPSRTPLGYKVQTPFDWKGYCQLIKVNSSAIFSDGFISWILLLCDRTTLGESVSEARNIEQLGMAWQEEVLRLHLATDQVEDELSIVYRPQNYQKGRRRSSSSNIPNSIISTATVYYNQDLLENCMQKGLEFWLGSRPPQGVGIRDAFKCEGCEYKEDCEWREEQADKWLAQLNDVPSHSTSPDV